MGLRPWLALTQDDHAAMLQTRALPQDRQRAKALHDAALATYLKLGMTPRPAHAGRAASQPADRPRADGTDKTLPPSTLGSPQPAIGAEDGALPQGERRNAAPRRWPS
jgi:hypothetical protein